ncbi:MAG: MaoC family dehydratase [Alphaproteobacteria bacterium]
MSTIPATPPARFFEDFTVGDTFYMPSRTVDDGHFAAQLVVSGDGNKTHYDREYCRARGFPDQLASGFQLVNLLSPGSGSFALGLDQSLMFLLDMTVKFLKPVFRNDTVQPMLKVAALDPGRTTGVVVLAASLVNQRGEPCLEATLRFLLRKRPPAGG